MNLYAESSAVLAWLLGEEAGEGIRAALASAERVFTSELTLVACDRVLIRAVAANQLREGEAADVRARLSQAAAHWTLLRGVGEVVDRSRRPFPAEPVRTLDALHLASALVVRGALPEVRLLSLDRRVRENGRRLGFDVLPQAVPEPLSPGINLQPREDRTPTVA